MFQTLIRLKHVKQYIIKQVSSSWSTFIQTSLKGFLHQHSFYAMEEYSNYKAVVRYILTTKLIFIILSLV